MGSLAMRASPKPVAHLVAINQMVVQMVVAVPFGATQIVRNGIVNAIVSAKS
eukprot:SAG31_NODE_6497_length_1995_cov_1.741034_1_plen_52_part_00